MTSALVIFHNKWKHNDYDRPVSFVLTWTFVTSPWAWVYTLKSRIIYGAIRPEGHDIFLGTHEISWLKISDFIIFYIFKLDIGYDSLTIPQGLRYTWLACGNYMLQPVIKWFVSTLDCNGPGGAILSVRYLQIRLYNRQVYWARLTPDTETKGFKGSGVQVKNPFWPTRRDQLKF